MSPRTVFRRSIGRYEAIFRRDAVRPFRSVHPSGVRWLKGRLDKNATTATCVHALVRWERREVVLCAALNVGCPLSRRGLVAGIGLTMTFALRQSESDQGHMAGLPPPGD